MSNEDTMITVVSVVSESGDRYLRAYRGLHTPYWLKQLVVEDLDFEEPDCLEIDNVLPLDIRKI